MALLSNDDAIFSLATPWGESAIAVIRLSGKDTHNLLCPLFKKGPQLWEGTGHTLHYCKIYNPVKGEQIDEIMLAVYKAPASYTGEDGAEIFCHGSLAIINRIIELLLAAGFRQAAPGEFTQRAFLNGKLDLTRAEAVNEIIRAKSDRARALALNRLSGAIEKRIDALKAELLELLASVEILIDYPDEDIVMEQDAWHKKGTDLKEKVSSLAATYQTGRILQEGSTVVIAGKTNAGKSTLFNLLLKEDRAIVSDIHGTTRDYLEGAITVHGIPVRLFDTAGLRQTTDPLEQEGIRRTEKLLENADLILFVAEAGTSLGDDEVSFLEEYRQKLICIWNKADLTGSGCPAGFIPLSARTGAGLEQLNERITALLINEASLESGEPVIDSLRQKRLLEECSRALGLFLQSLKEAQPLELLALDLKEALDCLGEITGVITSEDILKEMFSAFCVGK